MTARFATLYDIADHGGVPPWSDNEVSAWLFAFAVVSVLVLALTLAAKRKERFRWAVLPVLGAIIAGYLLLDMLDRRGTTAALAAGRLSRVQGCITQFVTNPGEPHGTKSSVPDEQWSVGGHHFAYKDWSKIPGYHRMEGRGGVVHARTYLRVGYLVSPVFRRQEIMRLDIAPVTCP